MEDKPTRKPLEAMTPNPENESPRRNWLYIFIAVLFLFLATYLFQQRNTTPAETVDSYSFDQLKDKVTELSGKIEALQLENESLQERIESLESKE